MESEKREPYVVINDADWMATASDADFILICTNKLTHGKRKDFFPAYGMSIDALASVSPVFADMTDLATPGREMWLNVEYKSDVLLLLLSAAFEPGQSGLRAGMWDDLIKALELAHLWRMDTARYNLYQALLCNVSEMRSIARSERWEGVLDFLCEAMLQGDSAFDHVKAVLRLRIKAGLSPIRIRMLGFAPRYSLELGEKRLAELTRLVMELAKEGALE